MLKLLASEWIAPESWDGGRLLVRGLNGLEWLVLSDLLKKGNTSLAEIAADLLKNKIDMPVDVMKHVLNAGVLDWDGMQKPDGSPWPFEAGAQMDLSIAQMVEAFGEIVPRSVIGPDAEKNLSSRPKSGSMPTGSSAQPADGDDIATKPIPPLSKNSSSPEPSQAGPA